MCHKPQGFFIAIQNLYTHTHPPTRHRHTHTHTHTQIEEKISTMLETLIQTSLLQLMIDADDVWIKPLRKMILQKILKSM